MEPALIFCIIILITCTIFVAYYGYAVISAIRLINKIEKQNQKELQKWKNLHYMNRREYNKVKRPKPNYKPYSPFYKIPNSVIKSEHYAVDKNGNLYDTNSR